MGRKEKKALKWADEDEEEGDKALEERGRGKE